MADSAILGIPQIGESQNNKYITHNNAVDFLEQASNSEFVNAAVGAGPVNLLESQSTRNLLFTVSGGTAAFNVVFPAQVSGNNASRIFVVANSDTTFIATIKASTGAGSVVALNPGQTAIIKQTFQDMKKVMVVTTTTSTNAPYDVGFFIPAKPGAGAELMRFVAVREIIFADEFAASKMHVSVNPTAVAVFTVKRNTATIGTISVSTGGVATFTTIAGTSEVFAIGERLSVTAPGVQDTTLAGLSVIFAGTRN